MITQGEWINGYGDGITGPTTPSIDGPTVHEAIADRKWKEGGCKGDSPPDQHTVISCDMQTIAIVPTIEPEGEDNAALIAAAPELLRACEAQHEAIDRLCAMLIIRDKEFLPSKSGQPWEALKQGYAAIKAVKGV